MADKLHNLSPVGKLRRIGGFFLALFLIAVIVYQGEKAGQAKDNADNSTVREVNWEVLLGELGYPVRGNGDVPAQPDEPKLSLHARAAVLMDGDSGRVLYGKAEEEEYPMASTTKIMTCIIALEYGNPEDTVTVSSYAASQPEVRLGIRSGETYRLRDLLYATMLTSYNDCAAAVAEHIGGSAEGFAALMNQKARDIGCFSTWFITPNGLDAQNEGGAHRTTARDLAAVLAYAIQNETFLEITRTQSYSFTDGSGKRSFTAVNKNAFLTMMDGALSGKTGFTAGAGYCYAGALRRDGRTFVAAVLGSGWPPNKSWKWADTRALMNYGLEEYRPVKIGEEDLTTEVKIPVEGGISDRAAATLTWSSVTLLAREGEQVTAVCNVPRRLNAPAPAGAVIGNIQLCLGDDPVLLIPVVLSEPAEEFTLNYCIEHTFDIFLKV